VTVERTDPPLRGDEKETLVSYLDYHRATLLLKCEGLKAEQLRAHAVPTSNLTLLGMLRHLVEVEVHWFRNIFKGEENRPIYFSDERPNDDLDDLSGADPQEVLERFLRECDASREIVQRSSLDDLSRKESRRGDGHFSMRWILVHMIEEYARHNGHADLLREAIDGTTGE
jgi:uncharacterized damage-inducible protein DinB